MNRHADDIALIALKLPNPDTLTSERGPAAEQFLSHGAARAHRGQHCRHDDKCRSQSLRVALHRLYHLPCPVTSPAQKCSHAFGSCQTSAAVVKPQPLLLMAPRSTPPATAGRARPTGRRPRGPRSARRRTASPRAGRSSGRRWSPPRAPSPRRRRRSPCRRRGTTARRSW